MQKIVPHLWFDTQAVEAAQFYTSAFEGSSIKSHTTISGTPSGDVDILTISLTGYDFMLINAGPYFHFNPSVSFLVVCPTKEETDRLHRHLGKGGSDWQGGLTDRYGLSWQILTLSAWPHRQRIIPTQTFLADQTGRAAEALSFYTSVFAGGSVEDSPYYPGSFLLEGQRFALREKVSAHESVFNEAISYMVYCDSQEEIDKYWTALSADPDAEQCGWLKDQFGFSWQIVPREMDAMMAEKDPAKLARITESFLAMKKFDLAELRRVAAL